MDLLNEIRMRADIKKLEQQKRSGDSQRHDLEARQRGAEEKSRLPAQVKGGEGTGRIGRGLQGSA